jgi:hypothetical protein
MEWDVNQHMQRNTLMGPSLIVVHASVVSGTAGISTLKAASGSRSTVTPSNNGQLMESAYLPTYPPPRVMQKIARGSRSPFILRVDVFALSPSLH